MKRITITLVLMLLLSSCATTGDYFSWDETNTKLHMPLTLLMIADLGQTLDIADDCRKPIVYNSWNHERRESNRYLGKCPSRSHVKQYFGWMLTTITATVWASPPKPSYAIQGGVIGVQLYYVAGNYYAGVGWGW